MTTVRLNEEIDGKIRVLMEMEHTSKSEIIKKAIVEYYEQHIGEKTPFELGKDLFGNHGSDSDLSTSYKSTLRKLLDEKHSH
jgi:Arc/MetJ-type ribon-helix-helix transcriptional regulator